MTAQNQWSAMADALVTGSQQAVKKTAFDIQSGYISRAPRDSGFLVNSCYVVTSDSSTYGQGSSPPGGSFLLPLADEASDVANDADGTTAVVGVGANYGVYVELGTRFMNAQPAFIPSVEKANDSFQDAISQINDRWQELGL